MTSKYDETLPNFVKRNHPRKGEKKKQRARTKVQASEQPKRGGSQRRQRKPLSTETRHTLSKVLLCVK